MSDFGELVAIISVTMGAFCVLIVVVAAPLLWFDYASCQSQISLGGLEGTWGPLVNCQVKTSDGHYIPYNRWRGTENLELKRAK